MHQLLKKTILTGHSTIDGAGVRLFRAFANEHATLTDPFLLLDLFGSDRPEEYARGFPWHPHRGIETVTYMLEGQVDHEDNIGNKGTIDSGDIQWMTAGSGIYHQEMPRKKTGMLQGIQLWVNLSSGNKMTAPKYRGITSNEIPVIKKDGLEVRVISGTYDHQKGPVVDLNVDVEYFDISLDQGKIIEFDLKKDYTTFCFLIDGSGDFEGSILEKKQLILFKDTEKMEVKATEKVRFLLVSGMPIHEPIAWGGPIVMNTREELQKAFDELDNGTFIKTNG
ncbi:MAG: pirin family protein [Bacteroidales bacterium]|nr:pirin family protein [Bacteroidales bacterium]